MTKLSGARTKPKLLSCMRAMSKSRFLYNRTSIGSVVILRRFCIAEGWSIERASYRWLY